MLFTICLNSVAGGRTVPGTPGPISGQVNVCAYVGTGQSVNYSIDPVAGAELYLWTVPPTVSIVSGQGTTSIFVSFSPGFRSSANKQLKVRAISQDGISPDRIFYMAAQQPSTPARISGPSNACIYIGTSTPATYTTARDLNATGYIWGTDPATTLVSHPNGTGVNDTIIHVIFKNSYRTRPVTVQSTNSCGFSAARVLTVSGSAPSMPGTISGPTNACAYMLPNGVTATYSISPVTGASSYTWLTPTGSIVDHPNGPGPGDISITIQFPSDFTSGTISVIANSGCDESAPRSLSISRLNPGTPGIITPLQKVICPDREYSYTIPAIPSNATSVNWTIPADATGFSGQGSASITLLYPESHINGIVTATAINNCASSSTRQLIVNLGRCQLERSNGTGNRNSMQAAKGVNPAQSAGTDPEKMEINIAPNPSKGNIKVQVITPDKNMINIKLLDLQGRVLKELNMVPGQPLILGGELKPGTYILEVNQGKTKRTEKFMKL